MTNLVLVGYASLCRYQNRKLFDGPSEQKVVPGIQMMAQHSFLIHLQLNQDREVVNYQAILVQLTDMEGQNHRILSLLVVLPEPDDHEALDN